MTGTIHPITMPKWGLAMTEGLLAAWTAEEGARIEPGTEIVDIETSKITNALESTVAGTLRRRVAEEGQTLPVGALLGVVVEGEVEDGELDRFIAAFQAEAAAAAESAAPPPEPKVIQAAGRPVRALVTGEGDGTPVVLIHGFGGDLNNWLFTQPALAGRPVHAIDLPGHGGSGKEVGAGDIAALSGAVLAYLDAAGIGKAHLAGHSMGGAVALALALDSPDRVASATLIAPAGLGAEINSGYIDGFIGAQKRKDLKPHLEALFADPDLVTRDLVEDVLKYKRLDGVEAALKTIAGAVFPGGRQAVSLRDRIGSAKVPVQVIWGTADAIVPAAHADGLPDSVPVHRFDGKGHMVHMEAAAEVNRLIADFVAAH
ncbi:acetoin dehydrogenase dihydrolipoyllysine-residue acetyltransferase subunit [Inquilinus limosus]|uniref:Acetoin dehydrogenase dihydrolipoyllysine-residue acetyltransferase subunit n=1 Tax=Inquilinus limosus TaxID=171674 RepID=A0A211ZSI3_9PROT|nr:acetoin dehydrogenase dihydrolipoyllysine-residue acetyltransferase subunit [Inquilinus limosus]OWJ68248.1 acetoin dehydrogenase dihydrolipoyllysine-residue acetyltransferase subunit [Inquilinus limosus]